MSTFPYDDLPGAGLIDEYEIDEACWRKRVVQLTQDQCAAVDETAGLCGVCGGTCPTPDACQLPEPPRRWRLDREDRIVLLGVAFAALCFCWLAFSGQLP